MKSLLNLIFKMLIFFVNRTIERTYSPMRGISSYQKPSYGEIRPMRGCPMRGPPVLHTRIFFKNKLYWLLHWAPQDPAHYIS